MANALHPVRARREALGISQVALAARVGVSRQTIFAVEAGRATPAVDVALRIARALDASVEALFAIAEAPATLQTEPAPSPGDARTSGRVALAHIADRWVSYALDGEEMRLSADAIAAGSRKGKHQVTPTRSPDEATHNVVLMGCASALGLLADRLNRATGPGRFLWLSRSSTDALRALANDHTHLAGVHLVDPRTGEANVSDVRRLAGQKALVLVTVARWEAGLVTARENPKRIRTAAHLGRRGVRLVVREAGSGARRLLDRELASAGLPASIATGAALSVRSHLDVARAITLGVADTGIATRDVALSAGLAFVPLAEERYDLVCSPENLVDPRIARLFDAMTHAAFRRELTSLGYDVRACGDRVAELAAA